MQYSTDNPIERLSEAEFKEAFEHIVKMKQYLLDMHEKMVDVQRMLNELSWMPPYMLEERETCDIYEIVRCRNIVNHAENNITSLLYWVATEERKLQNTSENQKDKKKEEEEEGQEE